MSSPFLQISSYCCTGPTMIVKHVIELKLDDSIIIAKSVVFRGELRRIFVPTIDILHQNARNLLLAVCRY